MLVAAAGPVVAAALRFLWLGALCGGVDGVVG